jgi:hypothetical protein
MSDMSDKCRISNFDGLMVFLPYNKLPMSDMSDKCRIT